MRLENKTRKKVVANDVLVAATFWERAKGLLGERELPAGRALWIQGSPLVGCNSIHTFFMRFAIDAVFVDRDLVVRKVVREMGPWRMTVPVARGHSVFELSAGALGGINSQVEIQVGDQLHVGD